MQLCKFLLSAILLATVRAQQSEKCKKLMADHGASPTFGTTTGHLFHSYTLNRLKEIYPDATVNNKIPTVNYDLKISEDVLTYTPDLKGPNDHMFKTKSMKTLDIVVWQNSNDNWVTKGLSTLSRLIHQNHMEEIMEAAKRAVRTNVELNPPNKEVCDCALDIKNNSNIETTWAMLQRISWGLHHPHHMNKGPGQEEAIAKLKNYAAEEKAARLNMTKSQNSTTEFPKNEGQANARRRRSAADESTDDKLGVLKPAEPVSEEEWLELRKSLPDETVKEKGTAHAMSKDGAIFIFCAFHY